nr:MAG TPA: hypothetical protein [Caudoviricetes sp.]
MCIYIDILIYMHLSFFLLHFCNFFRSHYIITYFIIKVNIKLWEY